jgi:glucan 1,3-beta-glucosidase
LSELSLAKLNADLEPEPTEKAPLRQKKKRKAPAAKPGLLSVLFPPKNKNSKSRVVSGTVLEDQGQRKEKSRWLSRKMLLLYLIVALVLIIAIAVGVSVGKKKHSSTSTTSTSGTSSINPDTIPSNVSGTYLDPRTWLDTTDFNLTYTSVMVGGLSIMGLNSTWDDSAQANDNVPALNEEFQYGTMPIRGVNIGGWLVIEPFITPSFFDNFTESDGVVDEYTLTSYLGQKGAATRLEQHYSSWVTESTFSEIAAAGFDHIRIPFPYWAVKIYDDDPYVPNTPWRYLLRGIEWARKYGIRINLDLHALPGSQNGWNHSGRQGVVGWLNGTDGDLNAQRALEIHDQLSQFFAQDRYKNVITLYGLVNEPRMQDLPLNTVMNWTEQAAYVIRNNSFDNYLVFGDGFLGLPSWKGAYADLDKMVLDVHQYVIFNTGNLAMTHTTKINFACSGWTAQMQASIDLATG